MYLRLLCRCYSGFSALLLDLRWSPLMWYNRDLGAVFWVCAYVTVLPVYILVVGVQRLNTIPRLQNDSSWQIKEDWEPALEKAAVLSPTQRGLP